MVMLFNPRCIAVYCIMEVVYYVGTEGAMTTAYAGELQRATVTLGLPKHFDREIHVIHNGTKEKVILVRSDLPVEAFPSWETKVDAVFHRNDEAGFTIKSVRQEDAGVYVCADGGGNLTYPGCECLLVVIVKPDQPAIAPLPGTSFKCTHSSRTRSGSRKLNHKVKWVGETGVALDVLKTDKFIINDKGELRISAQASDKKSLIFKCMTADIFNDTIPTTLLFSEPSPAFNFDGKPNNVVVVDNSPKPTHETKGGSNSTVWIVISTFIFVLVVFFFVISQQLIKEKPEEKRKVQELSESTTGGQLGTSVYSVQSRESEIS